MFVYTYDYWNRTEASIPSVSGLKEMVTRNLIAGWKIIPYTQKLNKYTKYNIKAEFLFKNYSTLRNIVLVTSYDNMFKIISKILYIYYIVFF